MKTSELTGAALDWAVAKCEQPVYSDKALIQALAAGSNGIGIEWDAFSPSTNWAQGGPIIERENLCIDIDFNASGVWLSWIKRNYDDEPRYMVSGTTPLIAAMRCYVASKLGDNVELPEELK